MSAEASTTGGPAYPGKHTYIDGMPASYEGMTLRDHFAAQSVSGVIAAHAAIQGSYQADEVAREAYQIADAMLIRKYETDPKPRDLGDDLPF